MYKIILRSWNQSAKKMQETQQAIVDTEEEAKLLTNSMNKLADTVKEIYEYIKI
jgi:hypothetical protein